jgi:hypothetical protein
MAKLAMMATNDAINLLITFPRLPACPRHARPSGRPACDGQAHPGGLLPYHLFTKSAPGDG